VRHRRDFSGETHVVIESLFTVAPSRRSNIWDQIRSRVTGIDLFTHEFLEIVPDETNGNSEEEDVHEHVVHKGVEWCSKTTEHRHIAVEGVAGKRFIDIDRNQVSVEGSFNTM